MLNNGHLLILAKCSSVLCTGGVCTLAPGWAR